MTPQARGFLLRLFLRAAVFCRGYASARDAMS
jgi:hypothetical protein